MTTSVDLPFATTDKQVAALVQALIERAQALGLIWRLIPGTVVVASPMNNLTVRLDGEEDVAIPVLSLTGTVRAGQRVMTLQVPPSGAYIIGGFNAGLPQGNGVHVSAATQLVNNNTYIDMTGTGFTFTKQFSGTRVKMLFLGSAFSSQPGDVIEVAFRLGTTDYSVTGYFFNINGAHLTVAGQIYYSNIPAGTYTVIGRFRLFAGVGAININASDRMSLSAEEVD